MMRSVFASKSRMVAIGLAGIVALSSCASGGSSTAGSTTSTSIGSSALSVSSAAGNSVVTAADIQVASKFVGGTAGAANSALPPIKIGLVANVSGPTAQPYLASTAESAAKFINTRLGGVAGGHPLQFVQCTFGGSAEEGQLCGQQFANDPDIKFVFFPGGTVGGPQLHAANNGAKAYLCTIASPGDATAADTYCTSGGPLGAGSMITYINHYLKAKQVSIISIDEPSLSAIVKQIAGLFAPTGIKTTIGLAPAGATDVTATVLASKAQTSDATLLILPTAATCIPFVKAFKSLAITKPVVALQQCAEDSVKTATGDYPEFTFYDYGPSPHLPDPQTDVYLHVMSEYGTALGATAPQVFGDGLLVAKLINELGATGLTTAAVSAKLAAYTGPTFLGDDTLSFGHQPFSSVGSLRARFYTYEGGGKWTDATKGAWLSALS